MPVYSLESNRVIAKDGEPILVLGLPRTPATLADLATASQMVDAIGHRIVALLNRAEEKRT